jgi:hypothetical protein
MAGVATSGNTRRARRARTLTLDEKVDAAMRKTAREAGLRLKRLGLVLPVETRPKKKTPA